MRRLRREEKERTEKPEKCKKQCIEQKSEDTTWKIGYAFYKFLATVLCRYIAVVYRYTYYTRVEGKHAERL